MFNPDVTNIAQLIEYAAARAPEAPFGVDSCSRPLHKWVEASKKLAHEFLACGLKRGDRLGFIGSTSEHYLLSWMAGQFAGLQTALINPHYPEDLLEEMLADLEPQAVLVFESSVLSQTQWPRIDGSRAWDGTVTRTGNWTKSGTHRGVLEGTSCDGNEISAFMHTSGTSGRPKFCALSHLYFIKLGRFIADSLGYTKQDIVYAPMPMFHINPLGYGVIAALTACAGVYGTRRFKAEEFWPQVKQLGATVVILHSTPTKLLTRHVDAKESQDHKVRVAYFASSEFLEKFDISVGISGYGSTEAGGVCHLWLNRQGDATLAHEGPLFYAGRPRFDVEAKISEEGEIWVRQKAPDTLFSGYIRNGKIDPTVDVDGWFHTGDRGRFDDFGNLVFIERASESIRVNGEYIPIDFVERQLEQVLQGSEFAIWGKPDAVSGQRVVLYVAAGFDVHKLKAKVRELPKIMRPVEVRVIEALPRDTGVNKIQRRRLGEQAVLESIELAA